MDNFLTTSSDLAALVSALERHPAVARAVATPGPSGPRVSVVPDAATAPTVHHACLIAAGLPPPLRLFDLSETVALVGVNAREVTFLYDEIMQRDAYRLRGRLALPARPVVVDVGANIGVFSVCVAALYPGARLFAVEPAAPLCAAIHANARLHHAEITVFPVAAADTEGKASLTYYPANTVMSGLQACDQASVETLRHYLSHENPEADPDEVAHIVDACLQSSRQSCPTVRLGHLLRDQALDRVDLLKIDVEQAELRVLAGLDDDAWARVRRVAVEVHDVPGRIDTIRRLLAERGFRLETVADDVAQTGCRMVLGWRSDAETVVVDEAARPGAVSGPTWTTRRALAASLHAHLTAVRLPQPRRLTIVAPDTAAP